MTLIGLGGVFALCAFVGLVVFAGDAAYEANNTVPFWQCVTSALALALLTARHPFPSSQEAIIAAFVFAIGGFLAFKAIRNGHVSTQVLGIVVAAPYVALTCLVAHNAFDNWAGVTSYWLD